MPNETVSWDPSEAGELGQLAGTTAGTLRIERLLGAGGLGEVYEATDLATGIRVAVKTVLPGVRNLEAIGRLEREALAGVMLDHPNIVSVRSLGQLGDGTPYIVMELVAGTNLGALLHHGSCPPLRALAIVRQTLDGLAHAHDLGVLHRDLKPENLMIVPAPEGELVKILDLGLAKLIGVDLGLAKLTETGAVFGTPVYMAPEQALGRVPEPATDLYAVGVILFELLAGRPPFVASDLHGILRLHVSAPPPRLADVVRAQWCIPELERVIERALQKAPEARFASAAEMRAAVWDAECLLR